MPLVTAQKIGGSNPSGITENSLLAGSEFFYFTIFATISQHTTNNQHYKNYTLQKIMDTIINLFYDNTINIYTVMLKLCISLILGMTLGLERQIRRHDAGLRTFSLVCVGSTGAMLISIWIPQIYPDFLNGDPGRIAAQVLTGVGFLGAGAIAKGKGSVQGLTTAACIWVISVIGLAVGAGLFFGALVATIATLFVLVSVEKIEHKLLIGGSNRILAIKCKTDNPDIAQIKQAIEKAGIRIGSYTYSIDILNSETTLTFRITLSSSTVHTELCDHLRAISSIVQINMMA